MGNGDDGSTGASEALFAARTNSIDDVTPLAPPLNAIATLPSTSQNGSGQRQKRARSQLSCTPCRLGKLKCNRHHDPACDQCIKRNREAACVYVPPPAKHRPAQNVKGRIRQLESLVVDLMNQNRAASSAPAPARNNSNDGSAVGDQQRSRTSPYSELTPPSDADTSPRFEERSPLTDIDSATKPFGQMRINKNGISYVGESHWDTILSSISDLKRELDEEEAADEAANDDEASNPSEPWNDRLGGAISTSNILVPTSGLGFLFASGAPVTREQLIRSVPDKKTTDRLLSLWFNSPDPFKPIIHAPTFQEQYRAFWRDNRETPTMWLGLLFAILSLAASFGLRDVDPSSLQSRHVFRDVAKYHSLAASAAVLADFTKPKPHTLECLIIYAAGLRTNEAFINVWLLIGLVLRLALRMGYHRDGSHYSAITPFESEMRRRTWAVVSMIDVLISFQLGLPSMVRTIQSDAQPPRNLLDRDFNTSTKVLPPGRGIHELTPCSYTRVKLKLVRIFGNAADLSHLTCATSHDEVLRLHYALEEAKASIPPLLQMPDISELVTDPAEQLMCRFNLDLLYLKTKMVLHRRFMLTPLEQLTADERQRGIGNSRMICTESALRVLHHHHTIYAACQPGGQLESVKWYMGSISTHDFLLAAMIICLELSYQLKDPNFAGNTITGFECPKRASFMEALEKSQRIWSAPAARRRQDQQQFSSKDSVPKGQHLFAETERAGRAMAVMIAKVKRQFGERSGLAPTPVPALPAQPSPQVEESLPFPSNPQAHNGYDATATKPKRSFNGILPNFDWNGADGLDAAFADINGPQYGYVGFSSVPVDGGNGQPAHFQTPPENIGVDQNNFGGDEFAMIGDMLDVPVNLDWEMWDQEIIQPRGARAGDGVVGDPSDGPPSNFAINPTQDSPDGTFVDIGGGRYGNIIAGSGGIPHNINIYAAHLDGLGTLGPESIFPPDGVNRTDVDMS